MFLSGLILKAPHTHTQVFSTARCRDSIPFKVSTETIPTPNISLMIMKISCNLIENGIVIKIMQIYVI